MGRQIQLALAPNDEPDLERFLRGCGPIKILQGFATSPEALEMSTLADAPRETMLFFWFTSFPWTPRFRQTETDAPVWYVENRWVAPILEYSRADEAKGWRGRLYWADRLSGEPEYDRIAFGKFVDRVWRWVRKTGTRSPPDDTWYFPEALRVAGPARAV
jgi:hypothetical protein